MSSNWYDKFQIISLLVAIFGGVSILTTTWRLAGRQEASRARLSGKYSPSSTILEERGAVVDPKAGEPDS